MSLRQAGLGWEEFTTQLARAIRELPDRGFLALQDREPPRGRHSVYREQVHGVLLRILLLPELHHALAEGAVSQPRARHDLPPQRFGRQGRGR